MQQFGHILRELVGTVEVAAQCACGGVVGTRRAAQTQIDAPRIQRSQRAELFGDLQRRVIGQHDAAGADADGRRATGDMADQHRSGGAGDAGHVVVLGQPEAAVAPALGVLGQIKHVAEGLLRAGAFTDGGQVENG
ncbi:hypothetical protein D3C81_1345350 [compost metagenome]